MQNILFSKKKHYFKAKLTPKMCAKPDRRHLANINWHCIVYNMYDLSRISMVGTKFYQLVAE